MDPETQALITAIAAAIGAIAIAYNTWQTSQLARKAEENRIALLQTKESVEKVVLHTNSMKDELVRAATLQGRSEGAEDQRNLQNANLVVPAGTAPVVIEEIAVQRNASKSSAKRRPLGRKRA